MKRRNFLTGLAPLSVLPLSSFAAFNNQEQKASNQQYIELIQYTLPQGDNKNRVQEYYKNAAIDALNKIGIRNVGVFVPKYGESLPTLCVILPHNSIESVLTYRHKLLDDKHYMQAASDYLNTSISNPAYIRLDTKLMLAFSEMPEVEPPKHLVGKDHIVEMRTYESHSYLAAQKKLEMFNKGGEIPIFKKTGLTPVFYGETLIGPRMPNLTYMLAFKDIMERDKSWAAFGSHPDWKKLSADTQYKDTVSNITDLILHPLDFSQI